MEGGGSAVCVLMYHTHLPLTGLFVLLIPLAASTHPTRHSHYSLTRKRGSHTSGDDRSEGLYADPGSGGGTHGVSGVSDVEIDALRDLFEATGGSEGLWVNDEGWNQFNNSSKTDLDPCDGSWVGVSCDVNASHVTSLALARNSMDGIIPASIANLTRLNYVAFDENNLRGIVSPLIDHKLDTF